MFKLFAVRRSALVAALVIPALLSAGCASTQRPPLPAELAQQSQGEYRLGLGDRLRINVFGERELSGEYQVSGSGVVTMPLIGDVPVVDLTARQVEQRITEKLAAGYLQHPSVSAEVFTFRPYSVLGEVEHPGRFPTTEGTSLLEAIAAAGGFTYRANPTRIYLRRATNPTEFEVDPNAAVTVAPGDIIRVGERHF